MPKTDEIKPAGQTERTKAITKAYTNATTILRERHLEEFNEIRVAETAKLGFEWTPPLTEAQKAKVELDRILAAHPELASTVGVATVTDVIDDLGPATASETPVS